jgi:diacylglycerol kinase (ATP)
LEVLFLESQERYLVVVNPVGRGGLAMKQGVWLLNKFRKMGIQHEALFTEKAGHARDLVANWADNVDVVVAVGGDGTVNEVINGIMDSGRKERGLAVFPSGTADDFARNMNIPRDKDDALKVMLGEYDKTIDLMLVNDRYAGVTVGIGLDAEIAYRSYGSKHLRMLAYWYHGLSMLLRPMPVYKLAIDVLDQHFEGDFEMVIAGNASTYGRYLKILPEARMDDGVIDLGMFRPMRRMKTLFQFSLLLAGKHNAKEFTKFTTSSMVIEVIEDVYAQFDGEAQVFEKGQRLEMSIKPEAIRVRVPREAIDAETADAETVED